VLQLLSLYLLKVIAQQQEKISEVAAPIFDIRISSVTTRLKFNNLSSKKVLRTIYQIHNTMRSYLILLCSLFDPMANAFQTMAPLKTSSFVDTTTTTNGKSRASRSLSLALDPAQAWESYNTALEANPLIVKSVTASVILGAADIAGQVVQNSQREEDDRTDLDIARTVRFAFFGLVLQAPWNHFYYQVLDGTIPPTADPWTPTTAIKTVIDQFVQAPIFTVLIFGFLGFLEGKNLEAIKEQLDDDYAETMVANWKLWVPATVINLAFVPPLLRVLYLNCVFFFWSIYLSLKLNKDENTSESA